ncbi:Hexapeptide repeat of succinyl-transferase [Aquiflexum balticum DSM 16537]|uniref:Hexapeptide repeat of succinyl-transferase n=1 Tax=Aquiflexum balticum DSM 16537 TaxID=758820 RepID=A0A1W2H6Q2_9BACT|nr:acyltransferase [Aquiflexum balticum]SMD44627.1 Hexapeptide repeat of succinyl-transferase [Aquiflexum balticum DSM 16537]
MKIIFYYLSELIRFLYQNYLRMRGVTIGSNTMISFGAKIDTHRGKIVIGNNCLITSGVKILSHDGASRMIDINDFGYGEVIIGNNVFVGVNSVILRNVIIGDNSVIAAGSIVSRNVPPNTVVGGNPAKILKELNGPFPILNDRKKY